jgi:hypothetical protein
MNFFYITCTLVHWRHYKENGVNLNLSFEKADSTPPPHLPSKGSRLAKKSAYLPQSSKTVFMNTVKKSQLIDSTLSRIFLC